MPAYLLVEIEIEDPAAYEEYRRLVPSTLAAYGGEYLVRGGRTETLEGDWVPKRLVVVRFESAAQAKKWWSCAEYAPIKAIRQRAAETRMVLVEGVE